jgi:hypothetical protein
MVVLDRVRAVACRWLLACGVLVLSACASLAPDPLASPPKAGESVVMLSMTGNTAEVTAVDRITVRRSDSPTGQAAAATFQMLPVAYGVSRDTSLFIAVLPEGEYEVQQIFSDRTSRSLLLSDTMRKMLGRFAVHGGKPVDLGRLVLTPVNTQVMLGRSKLVTSNSDLVRRIAPKHTAFIDGQAVRGWMAEPSRDDDVERYALMRPVGASVPIEIGEGRVAAASRLGSVLIRQGNGRWSSVHSAGLESLLDAAPGKSPDTTLVAVGEMNTMLRLRPGADRLEPIDPGNLPPGVLIFVDGSDQHGWYVFHQIGSTVKLLRSDKLDAGDWKLLRTESVAPEFWSGANLLWMWRRTGGLAYASSEGSIHLLDYASSQWTNVASPNRNRLVNLAASPNGSLGALTSPGGGLAGVFAGSYVSRDEGRTWTEVKGEFKVKVSPPLLTPSGTMLLPGGVFSTPELHASTDSGKTWQRRSDYSLDRSLQIMPSGLLLAIDRGQTGLFSIRSSSNEGTSWQLEYSNFDSTAYEARNKGK